MWREKMNYIQLRSVAISLRHLHLASSFPVAAVHLALS